MVTVAFPPRLVAMEMVAPFPSALLSSPLFSFSRSLSLLRSHADRHSHTREIPSSLLSDANLLSDDKRRLALSRSLRPSFAEGTAARGEREVEREEQTEETARERVRMRDTWSFAISFEARCISETIRSLIKRESLATS